nr:C39 family peptidase [Micromonospora sp. NBRC 107566]
MAQTFVTKSALATAGVALVGGMAAAGDATLTRHHEPTTGAGVVSTAPASERKLVATPASKEVRYEYQSQPNFFYCGPASTRIALTSVGHPLSQDDVAKALGTTEDGTNSAVDITRVLNSSGGKDAYETTSIPGPAAKPADVERLQTNVTQANAQNRAVVANIAGTAVDTDGMAHSYEGGHYLTVVGYRDQGRTVKIADPANPNVQSYWMNTSDLANWIATRGYSA